MKTLITLIFSIITCTSLQSQTIEIGSLFEFYTGEFQKNIRISKRIQEQWNLPNNFLQHTHYNSNTDDATPSFKSIKQVLLIYYKKNEYGHHIIELLDDGNHFDNEPDDGIYGNYIYGDFNEFITEETNINVSWDTLGINYHILQIPVDYLPEIPNIIAPSHQSIVFSDTPEIYWEIDPNADGCGAILLGNTPILGEELEDIIWEKEFRSNNNELFTEKIPVHLLNNKEYTLIIWAYTNTKQINNIWHHGAYSIEWCKFYVDTLQTNENLTLFQNFPNPFNSRTIIKYSLPEERNISINIYDIIGQEITTLIEQKQSAGEHYILWNGKNDFGNHVASGVYFCTIRFNKQIISQKMLLNR